MPTWLLTYQQIVLKRYHSDKHLSRVLPTRWRQKSIGIDMEQNYVTVTQYIMYSRVVRMHVDKTFVLTN